MRWFGGAGATAIAAPPLACRHLAGGPRPWRDRMTSSDPSSSTHRASPAKKGARPPRRQRPWRPPRLLVASVVLVLFAALGPRALADGDGTGTPEAPQFQPSADLSEGGDTVGGPG